MDALQRMITSGDWSGTLVALALITADVVLHAMGKPAEVFDQAVPMVVALYLGGHMVHRASQNGKPPDPPA